LRQFKENGYQIHFYFFGLETLDLSKEPVKQRARSGGHDVYESEIEMNYFGNMAMLDKHLDLIDHLLLLSKTRASIIFSISSRSTCESCE
jgi:predicted ABC-type ATPase